MVYVLTLRLPLLATKRVAEQQQYVESIKHQMTVPFS